MTDEEYYQLQLQQWNKFFSCCLQYQQQDNTPVACFADNNTGMVTVVKKVPALLSPPLSVRCEHSFARFLVKVGHRKCVLPVLENVDRFQPIVVCDIVTPQKCASFLQGAFTYLRPCHVLEHITLSSPVYGEQFYGQPLVSEGRRIFLIQNKCKKSVVLLKKKEWSLCDVTCTDVFETIVDEQLCRDLVSLSRLLQLVSSCMTPEMFYLFRQDIQHNQPPEQSAQQIINAIMAANRHGRS